MSHYYSNNRVALIYKPQHHWTNKKKSIKKNLYMYKSENMALFRQINAALLIPMGNKTKTERTLKTRSTR